MEVVLGSKKNSSYEYKYNSNDGMSICTIKSRSQTIRLPASPKEMLRRTEQYVGLQVKALGDFTFTVRLCDGQDNHFNLAWSTVASKRAERPGSSSETGVLVNLAVPKNQWTTVYFDLLAVAERYWRPGAFQALVGVEISGNCSVRNIFVHRETPVRSDDPMEVLPMDVRFPRKVVSTLVYIPSDIPDEPKPVEAPRASRIPTRGGMGSVRRSGGIVTGTGSGRPGRGSRPASDSDRGRANDPADKKKESSSEDDDDDSDPFSALPAGIEINTSLPDDANEELELIFIETLNCYYCPDNQQYYKLETG